MILWCGVHSYLTYATCTNLQQSKVSQRKIQCLVKGKILELSSTLTAAMFSFMDWKLLCGGDVDHHLEVLLKEGLLGYTMCLPAVLPVECQPRARSLVNELGKHRQLQPPSLCTLAKAHIAKTFCGLQPVMEMKSIGEFLHKYFSTS